jgi:hypothetical protein
MNCKMAGEQILKFFDKDCSDIEAAKLRQHLKCCARCNDEFTGLSKVIKQLEETGEVEPPDDFEAGVMKKIASLERTTGKKHIILLTVFLAVLVSVVAYKAAEQVNIKLEMLLSAGVVVYSAIMGIIGLVFDVLRTLLEANVVIIKSYYHVYVALLAMLLAIQKMFFALVESNRGGDE